MSAEVSVSVSKSEFNETSKEVSMNENMQIYQVARKVSINEIRQEHRYMDLFTRQKEVVEAVIKSMTNSGYDPAKPIVTKDKVIVDGHTRYEAARQIGLPFVFIIEPEFKDETEAIEYAVRSQVARRQLTDADIYHLVQELDKKFEPGRKSKNECDKNTDSGRSSDRTAELIGTYGSKVDQVRMINEKGTDEIKTKVISGEWSINKAANAVRALNPDSKKKPRKAKNTQYGRIAKVLQKASKLCAADDELATEIANLIAKIKAKEAEAKAAKKAGKGKKSA